MYNNAHYTTDPNNPTLPYPTTVNRRKGHASNANHTTACDPLISVAQALYGPRKKTALHNLQIRHDIRSLHHILSVTTTQLSKSTSSKKDLYDPCSYDRNREHRLSDLIKMQIETVSQI